jgi:hypothetical protein
MTGAAVAANARSTDNIVTTFHSLRGDANADGLVSGADLAAVLGAWGGLHTDELMAADFDGDALISAADLAVVLENWGARLDHAAPAKLAMTPLSAADPLARRTP